MATTCDKCKKKAENDLPVFKCDGCTSFWCKVCAALSTSEVRVLQFRGPRKLKFFCHDCSNFGTIKLMEATIQDKNDLILSKDKIIQLLEADLADKQRQLEASTLPNRELQTYAGVTATKVVQQKLERNLPCLVIRPRSQQSSSKTRGEIQAKIKPGKISAGVSMVRELRNGAVILKCDSDLANRRMKDEAQSVLGENYSISETKLLTPSVTISNISKEVSKDEIAEAVRSQNSCLTDEDEFRLKTVKTSRGGESLFAVLQCNGSCFRKLMSVGKVNIGFNKCPVYENLNLIRCYKCWRFNHFAKDCKEAVVCSRCAGSHSSQDCTEDDKKCTNCLYVNERLSRNFDTQHEATHKDCSVYKQKLDIFKQRINYMASTIN